MLGLALAPLINTGLSLLTKTAHNALGDILNYSKSRVKRVRGIKDVGSFLKDTAFRIP